MQRNNVPPPVQANQQNYFARNHKPHGLPPPAELAQRVEEAKTSAKLLAQVVQSTPPEEVLGNELIKEFGERCQSASRSVQGYIHSDNPPPDEDTLLTLIETNDQLATSMSRYQRALLQARRVTGASPLPSPPANPQAQNGLFEAHARSAGPASPGITYPAPSGPPPQNQMRRPDEQNPFGDHNATDQPPQDLQAPIAPQSFGLPPPNMSQDNRTPGSYEPGHRSISKYADNRQGYATNNTNLHGGDSDGEAEPEEPVRKPVQYRF